MLSKYIEDERGPVCRLESCKTCVKDCKEVYRQVSREYELEGRLIELEYMRAIVK